jgi:hypothetical protein
MHFLITAHLARVRPLPPAERRPATRPAARPLPRR